MAYVPKPIDTEQVQLTDELLRLRELLAKNVHEVWAKGRMDEGWKLGPTRDDAKREHPCLVPYEDLPESEKDYDRRLCEATLKAIVTLGFEIKFTQTGG